MLLPSLARPTPRSGPARGTARPPSSGRGRSATARRRWPWRRACWPRGRIPAPGNRAAARPRRPPRRDRGRLATWARRRSSSSRISARAAISTASWCRRAGSSPAPASRIPAICASSVRGSPPAGARAMRRPRSTRRAITSSCRRMIVARAAAPRRASSEARDEAADRCPEVAGKRPASCAGLGPVLVISTRRERRADRRGTRAPIPAGRSAPASDASEASRLPC